MKRLLSAIFALTLLLLSSSVFAQSKNYRLIRVDLGLTGAYSPGDLKSAGLGAYIQPMVNIHDFVSVGLRFEGDLLVGGNISNGGSQFEVGGTAVASYLAKGEFTLSKTAIRPFVGMGMGMYKLGSIGLNSDGGASVEAGRHFGVMPQVGINLGHFRMALAYNAIAGKSQFDASILELNEVSRNYFTFELAMSIGGGRK